MGWPAAYLVVRYVGVETFELLVGRFEPVDAPLNEAPSLTVLPAGAIPQPLAILAQFVGFLRQVKVFIQGFQAELAS